MKPHPLRTFREKHGLVMRQAAEALSISEATVSRIESRVQLPNHKLMIRIHKWTSGAVTPNDLLDIRR